ncbi:membrane dipeptidase [Pseudemcibacter aquimaris]|uniref:membrane dipeptidase n=1 Tax=Pseudemcibacter aquimaris TaxID=2857064 RepID=UPI002010CE4D|nr:membrane dipeptidase [Pseudemcibacter aquimaris]MCC3859901.1 dipeptidase [Pseudemcibacter aquimaris]WDU57233.1 dipeptidase [Pseudemcibacter aquimaris]
MDRRQFLAGASAVSLMGTMPAAFAMGQASDPNFTPALVGKPWDPKRNAMVFDAMGEIRDTYTDELIEEMLAAGMRAIAVTCGNPRQQNQSVEQNYQSALEEMLWFDRHIEEKSKYYLKATTTADIDRARKEGKLAIFYLTQNSEHFMHDLDNVDAFYGIGQRICQLTYNYQNMVGSGCMERHGSGITRFGGLLIEKLNDIEMMIDLSHSNVQTALDAIEISEKPIQISHTTCYDVNPNPRAMPDEVLRKLADKGGVAGITQMRTFMTLERYGMVHLYFDHIMHAINVMGIDHVGIGSDRDHRRLVVTPEYLEEMQREQGPLFDVRRVPLYFEELNSPRRMEVIWDKLLERGLSEDDAEKVTGLNFYNHYKKLVG